MNKKSLITIAIISIFLLSGHAVVASAGTKSSKVQSDIKQLEAVEKSLNKINDRLLKILDNDTMPNPNVNGVVGRLGAMTHHLQILNGFIEGNPPSDLEGVGGAAKEISDNIDKYSPNVATPEGFIFALKDVKFWADEIVSNSTPNPTIPCSDYTTQGECVDHDNCFWDITSPGGKCGDL